MNKGIKLTILLIVPLLLSSCTGVKIKKPSFGQYGQETSSEAFSAKYQAKISEFSTDLENRYDTNKVTILIDSYESSKTSSVSVGSSSNNITAYYESDVSYVLDSFNSRLTYKSVGKQYVTGNSSTKNDGRTIKVEDCYGEVLGGYFYYADKEQRTVTKIDSSNYDTFVSSALLQFLGVSIGNYSFTSGKETYYTNNNRFTYTKSNGELDEYVLQIVFNNNGITVRSKRIYVEKGSAGTTNYEKYGEAILSLSTKQLSSFDYFEYTFI